MKTKIGIVKIKPEAKNNLAVLLEKIRKDPSFAREQMKDKGYYWDSLFIDHRVDGDYLIYVIKSPDFSKIKMGDQDQLNLFSKEYSHFKNNFWDQSELTKLDDILEIDLSI